MNREKEVEEITAIINQALRDMAYPFALDGQGGLSQTRG